MDRTLTLDYPAAIPVGHRVEVTEFPSAKAAGESFAVTDLDTGIHYRPSVGAGTGTWQGQVLACTVVSGGRRPYTTLVVSVSGASAHQQRLAAEEAQEALGGADAALAAARAEALRWGSSPGTPPANP